MRRPVLNIAAVLTALVLGGADSCEPELVTPKGGYVIVENVLSPVLVRTSQLEGAGRLEGLSSNGSWALVHFSPNGAFIYHEPIPGEFWHCSNPGGTEGCAARLRVAHDPGPIGPNPLFGPGIVHVCTEGYVQRQGRIHCGARELAETEEGELSWTGDPWNRVVVGTHAFNYVDADSPPGGAAALEASGRFADYRWQPGSGTALLDAESIVGAGWQAHSIDLGACSFFIPWEWEHRLEEAYYTPGLGVALDERGLAEMFLDEMIDTSEPVSRSEVNALLWIDGTVGIVPNESASPEFHYRLAPESGEPQICFKQYFHASSGISAKPDHWYRFDQAIGAFFLELLPFIGSCGYKNLAIRYCGTAGVQGGRGHFEVDTSSVHIAHQGYPWGKALCNNQFVPRLLDGLRATFEPGGEGAQQIDDGVALLVDALGETLGLRVRRIELSPRGMYLVTADTTADPQYGLGDCRSDLDRSPTLPAGSRATETGIEYETRGVTRF